ncbi:MAG: hypothetical protein WBC51_12745 [Vicinamibacterales bacterium]
MRRLLIAVTAMAVVVCASPASAQVRRPLVYRDTPHAGSWELGGGVVWTGGFTGPTSSAELTRNGQSSGGFDLFTAAGEMKGGVGAGATIAVFLSRSVAVEGGFRVSQPSVRYRLSGDAEEASDITAQENLTRYVFTGSLLVHLRRMSPGVSTVPFIAAGAGYVRDLHQGNELLETGTEFHGVVGLKYWFNTTASNRFGIRGEAGVSMTDGGFDFSDKSRLVPIASASLVYLF